MHVLTTSTDDPARAAWAAEHFDDWYAAQAAGESHGRADPALWQPGERRAQLEHGTVDDRIHLLLARDAAGAALGAAEVWLPVHDNAHLAIVDAAVVPAHRRRGVGTALLRAGLDVAAAAGRTRVRSTTERPVGVAAGDWPGSAAATAWGFAVAQAVVRRQLLLPPRPGLLDELERAAAPRATGYAVRTWAGPAPQEHVDAIAHLASRMSTDAPRGELSTTPEVWDATRVREGEVLRTAQGRRWWTALALAPGGEPVGYTVLVNSRHEPQRLLQHDTLVVREHRGHRLGLLLKVACLRAALHDVPGAERVTTWNAASNAPMVAVNEALGFRCDEVVEELEAPLEAVRAAAGGVAAGVAR
ncbi:GNAT family N-acetyltransferase [Kineococcus sp. TRM81007]|uniref:GNAT family N-acetyltransferase n=1 Tax=Kineococcus sp. TRM81007 TaxID=2925831 RepID=UPI001F583932|nr:GNAT family N-acetyltransferase [Kineococcus sp. TRM81007]MCI2238780.1 GNAT family N-acetyltransferase [Kineococcus sp. TRM81007]